MLIAVYGIIAITAVFLFLVLHYNLQSVNIITLHIVKIKGG